MRLSSPRHFPAMATSNNFLKRLLSSPVLYLYWLIQLVLDKLLSPNAPPPNAKLSKPSIAVIGAGLTKVAAASHCVGHGFDTTIFEAGDEDSVGGIWDGRCPEAPAGINLLNLVAESEQHVRSPDSQPNVPVPSINQMEEGLPGPRADCHPSPAAVAPLRSQEANQIQHQGDEAGSR